jgi:hypothetical protein
MSSLYWFGLYEQPDAKKWRWVAWVHEVDLAPAIGYSILRAIGICKHTHILPAVWR